jgi:glycolate oxidase iron-sulfur subunit
MPVAHTVQMLDASIRGVPVEQLLDAALNGPGTVAASSRPGRDRASAPSS